MTPEIRFTWFNRAFSFNWPIDSSTTQMLDIRNFEKKTVSEVNSSRFIHQKACIDWLLITIDWILSPKIAENIDKSLYGLLSKKTHVTSLSAMHLRMMMMMAHFLKRWSNDPLPLNAASSETFTTPVESAATTSSINHIQMRCNCQLPRNCLIIHSTEHFVPWLLNRSNHSISSYPVDQANERNILTHDIARSTNSSNKKYQR